MLPSVRIQVHQKKTKLQFHWSIIITSSYHNLFIEKVKSSELLIKQPRYGGSRRRTQIPWLATMSCDVIMKNNGKVRDVRSLTIHWNISEIVY